MKVCCFTGHRVLPGEQVLPLVRVIDRYIEALAAQGVTEFRTGGALGFDTLAALRVLAAKEKNPSLCLSLILPCRDQALRWREGDRALYEDILSKADEVRYVRERYSETCMRERNHALIEGSDVCLAYLTHSRGGTKNTFLLALREGLEVINLAEELE